MGRARRKDKDAPLQSEEPKLYVEPAVLECTLTDDKIRQLIDLPPGLDYNEWLASHTIAFFDHINLIYGTISEYCTMSGCPDMSGPKSRQYLWFDEKGKKCKVAAPQYVDYVMTFTQKTVNDETIFPTKFEKDFPSSFESIVKKIHRLLFHVVAHLYHGHFREILLLSLHSHLNCLFSHFTLFNERFKVVDDKETDVLQDLAVALKLFPQQPTAKDDGTTTSDGDPTRSGSPTGPGGDGTTHLKETKDFLVSGTETTEAMTSRPSTSASPSITSSISALHSRTSSGGHSNSNSCAMDSAIYSTSSSALSSAAAPCGSSPIKFQ